MLKRALVAAVPCLFVLSGCGVVDTEFNPGVAVRVGDETISSNEVDDLTSGFCEAVEEQIAQGGQAIPLAGFRSAVAAQLALRSAAEQVAEPYGVEAGPDYQEQLTQITQQADDAGYTGQAREAYIEVQSTQPYYIDLLTQVGRLALEAEGEEDPTVDFQQARGQDELAAWVEREGVTFDPRYGIAITDGAPAPADTEVTVAVSDLARAGQEIQTSAEPDAAYVAGLPQSATCG